MLLPADYVAASVDLGYACTIHAAQGVTADSMHGVLTGAETRQQLYTMMTRGRHANHVYLEVVGDGDTHTLIRPEAVIPPTATDLLEAILCRDDAPTSATRTASQVADPAGRLADATARYTDALGYAAETTLPAAKLKALDATAEQLVPGLTDAPAWPTLRAHLLLDAAHGTNPIDALRVAVAEGPLGDAADPAAVLDWRIATCGRRDSTAGPLPWLPGIPTTLARHRDWGDYLQRRQDLVTTLAGQIRADAVAATKRPVWLAGGITAPDPTTLGDVAAWRAAHGIPHTDTRPTGERQHGSVERRHQHLLDQRIVDQLAPAASEWTPTITSQAPATNGDPFLPVLAHRLAQVASARLDAAGLLRAAVGEGVLPDHHPAAALWWRISRHINPAVAVRLDTDHQTLLTNWLPDLEQIIGHQQAAVLQESQWWPPLVTTIENALARGWHLDQLITPDADGHLDDAQALVWRTSLLLAPIPDDEPEPEPNWETIPNDTIPVDLVEPDDPDAVPEDLAWLDDAVGVLDDDDPGDLTYSIEAQIRRLMQPPGPSEANILTQLDRAHAWLGTPHTPERFAAVNELAAQFYQGCYRGSWAQPYLAERFRTDLTGDPDVRPGYAPNTWTALTNHLRRHGVTDDELIAVGLAKQASTGRLIDRFRDRVVFPITHDGQILGFVGRRNPDRTDDETAGPKYLNTPETLLFHKRAQLYVVGRHHLDAGATPVLVEGPMDAIAITLAGGGRYVGAAALGTALSSEQATQLRGFGLDVIIATDADAAGQEAARRDFWTLAPQLMQPRLAVLPDASDPAQLLANGDAAQLTEALDRAAPMAESLLVESLAQSNTGAALAALATQPPDHWEPALAAMANRTGTTVQALRLGFLERVRAFSDDPYEAERADINRPEALGARHRRIRRDTDSSRPPRRHAPQEPSLM